MSYPINYPTPQGANIQIFGGNGSGIGAVGTSAPVYQVTTRDWVKPVGCSFVWFTLIGAGAGGTGNPSGGGSGAVTNFMCPAFLIPDVLQVNVGNGGGYGRGGSDTTIVYQNNDSVGYTLLTAAAGISASGGPASTSNFFTAMGFFQSIAGQDGSSSSAASTTTFLSSGGYTLDVTPNYGYPIGTGTTYDGFFQMQPIIVGRGGRYTGKGGIGCGGGTTGNFDGYQNGGGDGLAVIISW
jgi:hypothetical protein